MTKPPSALASITLWPIFSEKRGRSLDSARHYGKVLLSVDHVSDGALHDAGADTELPQNCAGLSIDALDDPPRVAIKHQAPAVDIAPPSIGKSS